MTEAIKIFPSIMAVNYADLGAQVREVDAGGADGFHLDIMDGHFVPNLTFGPDLVASIRSITDKEFDAHLMVTDPEPYIASFQQAGVDSLSIHVEIEGDVISMLDQISAAGMNAGLAIKPSTSLEKIPDEAWGKMNRLLVMTVEPGFGGQKYMDQTAKIQKAKEIIKEKGLIIDIQVDGGINPETAPSAIQSGAQTLVAGSAVFKAPVSIAEAIRSLRP